MKRWQWAVLLFDLGLFAVILILPQVDLPDFTFHGVTAPVTYKARVSQRPAPAIALSFDAFPLWKAHEKPAEPVSPFLQIAHASRLSLICTLLC